MESPQFLVDNFVDGYPPWFLVITPPRPPAPTLPPATTRATARMESFNLRVFIEVLVGGVSPFISLRPASSWGTRDCAVRPVGQVRNLWGPQGRTCFSIRR